MPKSKKPLNNGNIEQLQRVVEFLKIRVSSLKLNPFDNLVDNKGIKRRIFN
jgi:hypothetical protein